MKIGLIICVDEVIERTQMFGVRYMPVWAYTLASYIRDIHSADVFLYDTRVKPKFKTPAADIYFISGINQDYDSLIVYLNYLRQTNPVAKVILGGPIVSSYKLAGKLKELEDFDHLFLGDGETAIKDLVQNIMDHIPLEKLIQNNKKFDLNLARPMDRAMVEATHGDYYGAVIEVSRGCPFLCEFCDIRTKPDNNTNNNKKIDVIIEELNTFCTLGQNNILLACDNFIGTPTWAEAFCDGIIAWKKNSGHQPRFYTWLTINISYHPRLLEKMKLAGFDMFFIGIESFGMDQLLETAKLQNVKTDISESIKTIQSYGFIVVAGLIFGFDTDPEDVVDVALQGIKNSGLISGDPSLLTALPGTPLYRRMELSKRLRQGKLGLGGKKYVTNIVYLRNKERMINDFIRFVHEFNTPLYQFQRFENFLKCLEPRFQLSASGKSYINLNTLFKLVSKNPGSLFSVIKRFAGVINSPSKLFYVIKAMQKTMATPDAKMSYFYFWLFNWSNSILKYGDLNRADFDIDSIKTPVTLKDVLPDGYDTDYFEPIPMGKIKAQRQATIKALTRVFANE